MIESWIIEEEKRKEREKKEQLERDERRPRLPIPEPPPGWVPKKPAWQEEEPNPRGVYVVLL